MFREGMKRLSSSQVFQKLRRLLASCCHTLKIHPLVYKKEREAEEVMVMKDEKVIPVKLRVIYVHPIDQGMVATRRDLQGSDSSETSSSSTATPPQGPVPFPHKTKYQNK
ncbi:Hypothetical predicted protein [Podarcis lilfordi]|uniref:Uncharacterized protein n=1 Tax=Podarcis lilfordi TaxID=74358 RepID=A0AA35KG61_9SAUR|nr:Hypothetical predicted protein [Podarcis lilfordi]